MIARQIERSGLQDARRAAHRARWTPGSLDHGRVDDFALALPRYSSRLSAGCAEVHHNRRSAGRPALRLSAVGEAQSSPAKAAADTPVRLCRSRQHPRKRSRLCRQKWLAARLCGRLWVRYRLLLAGDGLFLPRAGLNQLYGTGGCAIGWMMEKTARSEAGEPGLVLWQAQANTRSGKITICVKCRSARVRRARGTGRCLRAGAR